MSNIKEIRYYRFLDFILFLSISREKNRALSLECVKKKEYKYRGRKARKIELLIVGMCRIKMKMKKDKKRESGWG